MKKFLLIAALLATVVFVAPASANSFDAVGESSFASQKWDKKGRRKWKNRGPKASHGYKNYGQYRRTQVGNRRYRMVRRPYYRNGIRLSRLVRLYY